MKLEDLIYFFTSSFLWTSIIGAAMYDLSMSKVLATLVQTGGLLYALITLPIGLYSGMYLFLKDLSQNVVIKFAVIMYTVTYTGFIIVINILWTQGFFCTVGFTTGNTYFDAVAKYSCGTVTGYAT